MIGDDPLEKIFFNISNTPVVWDFEHIHVDCALLVRTEKPGKLQALQDLIAPGVAGK